MNYNNHHCQLAANIFEGEPGLLNVDLIDYLNRVSAFTIRLGGRFYSRQAIALAVAQWLEMNPDKNAYITAPEKEE